MSKRKKSIFKERKRINYKLIFGLFVVACVAVFVIAYAMSALMSQKNELYEQGVSQYEAGEYETAAASFTQALSEHQLFSKKKDMNIKMYLADTYLKSARYSEAASLYGELADASYSGADVENLKDLAAALGEFSSGSYGSALDVLVKQSDSYPELYMYIGTCYSEIDDTENMIASYEKYVSEFGFNSYVYAMYASYNLNKDEPDLEQAIAYINNGLSCNDTVYRKELLMLEICYYEKQLDYDSAFELAGQLISEYPDYEQGQREYTFLSTRATQ